MKQYGFIIDIVLADRRNSCFNCLYATPFMWW